MSLFKKEKPNIYKISTFNEENSYPANWLDEDLSEGQLLVDVYQNLESIIVKSTIAGVKPENLFISLNKDMLTIKGRREHDELIEDTDCLLQECYFGSFSRTIILPEEVDAKKIEAILENGVLTIIMEKMYKESRIKVKIKA